MLSVLGHSAHGAEAARVNSGRFNPLCNFDPGPRHVLWESRSRSKPLLSSSSSSPPSPTSSASTAPTASSCNHDRTSNFRLWRRLPTPTNAVCEPRMAPNKQPPSDHHLAVIWQGRNQTLQPQPKRPTAGEPLHRHQLHVVCISLRYLTGAAASATTVTRLGTRAVRCTRRRLV